MLQGIQLNKVEQVLQEMEKSIFAFHLTGSRFFGFSNEKSDYDFFVEKESGLTDFLQSFLGFKQHSCSSYKDSQTVEVYRSNTLPWVDVQIVKNAKVKVAAQNLIKEFDLLRDCDKQKSTRTWDKAINLVSKWIQ